MLYDAFFRFFVQPFSAGRQLSLDLVAPRDPFGVTGMFDRRAWAEQPAPFEARGAARSSSTAPLSLFQSTAQTDAKRARPIISLTARQSIYNPKASAERVEQAVVNTASASAFAPGNLTPNQFDSGLSSTDAVSACGPAAAIAFARVTGRNPTLAEAVDLARQVGWTPERGMAGPESQVRLLEKLGIRAELRRGVDWNAVAAVVSAGRPVIIDTPQHYFVAERYDPQTGRFDFGASALVLRASGGQRWLSPDDIARLGYQPRSSIYLQE